MVEKNGKDEVEILARAGFTGVDSGRDVRMFGGRGIRHDAAAFDPTKANERNIFLGLAGGGLVVPGLKDVQAP
jgi:hypothetical protein